MNTKPKRTANRTVTTYSSKCGQTNLESEEDLNDPHSKNKQE